MKTHKITFQPNGVTILCREDEAIADAALRQGVIVPVSCENGICQICQGDRISGELNFRNSLGESILDNDNQVLCCVAQPKTDIEIVMNDVYAPNHKPEVALACQIPSVSLMADNMYRVELLAPAGKSFDYWPGQYLMLDVEDENGEAKQFPYSIASAPGDMTGGDRRRLELHIAANSPTAEAVVKFLQNAVVVRATLPGGDCLLTPDFIHSYKQQPLLMVAAGSGFSQMKALIEGALTLNPEQEIHLYWSNRAAIGFYLSDLPQQWAYDYPNFHYHPIIEQHTDDWNGRAGWIYQVIHEDFDDLSQVQMFACGSPNMVYGTLDQLEKLGLTQENMHSDVFAYAPRPA
ncbi:2Fe-2S iron-sulfur cluster-binding protein [Bacterioplanoides sp.]|uniref:2Fe-2S iron-sulfur cluster-binding protein n=1 Tax=Bacterioplanoides sp. TaxID=2066072 RepID=UPI003AFFCA0B